MYYNTKLEINLKEGIYVNYKKKSIRDVSFKGKKVLLRVDFNVPLDKKTHEITNDKIGRAHV